MEEAKVVVAEMKLGSVEASERLIFELYIDLRRRINAWAAITEQTAQARMGYIGQHLVSIVTGFKGGKSGARGKDLVLPNGKAGEIKTCYRVDQLGKCLDCGAGVASIEKMCAVCSSENISRKDDSKWLIGIRNEAEFESILEPQAYYLVLFDFVDLAHATDIRASIWEVDPLAPGFGFCMVDYYLEIRAKSISKAPFNFWPFSPKFELMRPKLIYRSLITETVSTEIFPGREAAVPHPLSPLVQWSASRTITEEAVVAVAGRLHVPVSAGRNKAAKLALLDEGRNAVSEATLTDYFAEAIYWPRIQGHVDTLPPKLKATIQEIYQRTSNLQ